MRLLLAALVLAGALSAAHAHDSWISRNALRNGAGEWCCGEGDCFVVPRKNVSEVQSGYRLRFDQVIDGKAASATETVPYPEAQPSPDGEFWRCKRPDGSRRCFFAPPPTD